MSKHYAASYEFGFLESVPRKPKKLRRLEQMKKQWTCPASLKVKRVGDITPAELKWRAEKHPQTVLAHLI